MMLTRILGQETAIDLLERGLKHQRLAHAYIFEGPSGIGKTKTARALACAILCQDVPGSGCGTCSICQRVMSGDHPDVRIIPPRKEGGGNLKVEFVREEILPFCRYAPFEGRSGVLIFPDADLSFPPHQPESANALLKILEEPRQGIHFVLVTSRPRRLLSTIRSRCQSLRFKRLSHPVLKRILDDHGHAKDAGEALVLALSNGRADRALWLAGDKRAVDLVARTVEIASHIDATRNQGPLSILLELAASLAQDDSLPMILDALAWLYRDLAIRQLDHAGLPLAFSDANVEAAQNAQGAPVSSAQLAEHITWIRHTERSLERTVNKQLALESLLFRLAQA
ncbi:MAG: AAA family ATPase [Myxococcales bacterium]|nr:AAA family ATPase [Myxococcales bacterium]